MVLPKFYQDVKDQIKQTLEKGVIKESYSPWAGPTVLVRKKDGSIKICVDYRRLSALTRKDAYPLPRIEESQNALGRAKLFSTLDLVSGYWKVAMDPEDRQKTAFTAPMGRRQCKLHMIQTIFDKQGGAYGEVDMLHLIKLCHLK